MKNSIIFFAILTAIMVSFLPINATAYSTIRQPTNTTPAYFNAGNPLLNPRKCRGGSCPTWMGPNRFLKGGQLDIRASVGLIPSLFMDKTKTVVPPLQLELSYQVSKKFSISALYGQTVSRSQPFLISDGIYANRNIKETIIAIRPAVHITKVEDWDIYGGAAFGIRTTNITADSKEDSKYLEEYAQHQPLESLTNKGYYSGFMGVRYAATKRIQVGGEIGMGVSLLTVGVSYRLL